MIKYIIFDLSGVLVKSGTSLAITKIARLLNLTEKEVKAFLFEGSSYGGLFRLGKISASDFWAKALSTWGKDYDGQELNRIWIENHQVNQEVIELVKDLFNKRYQLGIVSNLSKDRFEFIDRQLNLSHYFSQMVLSYKDQLLKPDKKCFLLILQKLGVKNPQEAVYIDDKQIHANAAKSVGIFSLVFKNVSQLKEDLRKLGVRI